MCRLLAGTLGARRALAPRLGAMIQQRATLIFGKPPKEHVGAVESALVLTVMTLALLGPSGWILAHLDHYKTRN